MLAARELPRYGSDESKLVGMIAPASPPDPNVAHLAMPEPAHGSDLFVAPGAASEIADLRGEDGPPIDHFSRQTDAKGTSDQGFFSKLFASLIE